MQRMSKSLIARLSQVEKHNEPKGEKDKMRELENLVQSIEKKCGPCDGSLIARFVHSQSKAEADIVWNEMNTASPYGPFSNGMRGLMQKVATFHGLMPWLSDETADQQTE